MNKFSSNGAESPNFKVYHPDVLVVCLWKEDTSKIDCFAFSWKCLVSPIQNITREPIFMSNMSGWIEKEQNINSYSNMFWEPSHLNLICTRIMKLSLILEKMFSWIHPQDLSWVYVFCWGMLMQGKHTLCVPPLWLTVKDIENREDQGVNIMNKTPKSCDQLISYATIILWTSI